MPTNESLRSKNFTGHRSHTAGWGRFQESGRPSNFPSENQIPVLDNEQCKERFFNLGKLASENQFGDNVICAGYLNGIREFCEIDSGGPLMQPLLYNGLYSYYQIGISSYSIGCASTNTPGVYTRVQHYID